MLFKTPLQAHTAFAAFILPLLIVGTMDRHDPILQAPERKTRESLSRVHQLRQARHDLLEDYRNSRVLRTNKLQKIGNAP